MNLAVTANQMIMQEPERIKVNFLRRISGQDKND
jgi:hypothetical protein